MSRRRAIVLGLGLLLAGVLAANALTVSGETAQAEKDTEGATLVELGQGTVQVTDSGKPALPEGTPPRPPIVLLHCFSCSLRWWDRVMPALTAEHRVIRIDLLGHGGSEKPRSGYEIASQAGLVAQVLSRLGVQGAVVVGHSMGGGVATSLAESSSQLVDRVMLIGSPPNAGLADLGLTAKLASAPILGQATWSFAPSFLLRSEIEGKAFGEGFDTAVGFEDEDQPLDDLRSMTYTAFDRAPDEFEAFLEAGDIPSRLRAALVPVSVVYGEDDSLVDPEAAAEVWKGLPAAEQTTIAGVGHSPPVEAPERTADLILRFAAEAVGDPNPAGPRSPKRPARRSGTSR